MEQPDFNLLLHRFAANDCTTADIQQMFDALLLDKTLLYLADAMDEIAFENRIAFSESKLIARYNALETRRTRRLLCPNVPADMESTGHLFFKNCPDKLV